VTARRPSARRNPARHAAANPGAPPDDDDRSRLPFRVGDALRQRKPPGGRRRGQEELTDLESSGGAGYDQPGLPPGPGAGAGPGPGSGHGFDPGPQYGPGPGPGYSPGSGPGYGPGPGYGAYPRRYGFGRRRVIEEEDGPPQGPGY